MTNGSTASKAVLIGMMSALLHGAASGLTPAQRAGPPAPPMPFEDPGACPFEGCTYREWVARESLVVRTQRRDGSTVAFRVRAGEKVTALTGVVVTHKPGRVEFRSTNDLAAQADTVRVDPEAVLYLLTYHGEGEWTAWSRGRLYRYVEGSSFANAVCHGKPSGCTATIVERPQSIWWVKIRNARGQVGWTREADKFDGKDKFSVSRY